MFILKIPENKFYFLTVKYERNNLIERKKDVRSKISRNNNNNSFGTFKTAHNGTNFISNCLKKKI